MAYSSVSCNISEERFPVLAKSSGDSGVTTSNEERVSAGFNSVYMYVNSCIYIYKIQPYVI